MMRKEQISESVTLYQGDCREILPTLGKFDAVVTDPPYGIKAANGFTGCGGFSKPISRREYDGDWDNERPPKAVFDSVLAASNNHIIWGGNYFTDYLPVGMKWFWWDKCQTMPTFSDGELAWTSLQGVSVKKIKYNNNGVQAKEKDRVHPTQKPVEVMRWCISHLPSEALTILDPFMGSGTTGVAAVKMGRQFTGIELEPKYFDIACKRISEALKQPDLFINQPKTKPKELQQSML
jgi:DNA modification methylase